MACSLRLKLVTSLYLHYMRNVGQEINHFARQMIGRGISVVGGWLVNSAAGTLFDQTANGKIEKPCPGGISN